MLFHILFVGVILQSSPKAPYALWIPDAMRFSVSIPLSHIIDLSLSHCCDLRTPLLHMQLVDGDPLGDEVERVDEEVPTLRKKVCEFAGMVEGLSPSCEGEE